MYLGFMYCGFNSVLTTVETIRQFCSISLDFFSHKRGFQVGSSRRTKFQPFNWLDCIN